MVGYFTAIDNTALDLCICDLLYTHFDLSVIDQDHAACADIIFQPFIADRSLFACTHDLFCCQCKCLAGLKHSFSAFKIT